MDEAQQAVLGTLAAQMFAEPIATGEVVVDDPEPVAPVAVQAAPAPTEPVAEIPPNRRPPLAPPPEAQPEAVVEPENVPTFKAKLDDELQAFLDEPDFDEEARTEVAAEVEDGQYEYDDPETAARERAKDKRIQFLETQLAAKSRKGWVEEGKRVFPDLARLIPGELEGIEATSRRAFLREAARRNDRYATVLAPTLARLEAERAAIASGAVQVARQEVADAWGRPAADTLPPVAAAQQEALAKARAAGDLTGAFKALMDDPTRPPVLP